MKTFLDFEKPIAELEGKIEELKQLSADKDDKVNIEQEIAALEAKVDRKLKEAYAKLSPWQKTQVARHPNRPHFNDYVRELIEDFTPLAGDRAFADDQAIMGGLGRFRGQSVLVIGHEKGNDTASRIKHNFGMARPEGYRKAIRLMGLAERFKLPVLTLIDTTGAYPGIGAEERGQAEAIARSTQMCLELGVPVVATVIGEGGSGGAVALAAGNRVLMMENAVYSVISPEGCASILWRTADKAAEAAKAMRITAADLKELNVIDEVVAEPVGGAHRDPKSAIHALGEAIDRHLRDLRQHSPQALKEQRAEKFLAMGTLGGA